MKQFEKFEKLFLKFGDIFRKKMASIKATNLDNFQKIFLKKQKPLVVGGTKTAKNIGGPPKFFSDDFHKKASYLLAKLDGKS